MRDERNGRMRYVEKKKRKDWERERIRKNGNRRKIMTEKEKVNENEKNKEREGHEEILRERREKENEIIWVRGGDREKERLKLRAIEGGRESKKNERCHQ